MPKPSTSPRKQPKQARARATRDAVVTAAAQLLAQVGYARATTNAIAHRAGVSIGSLYEYFPNKDAIVSALIAQLLDQQFEVFSKALTVTGTARESSFEDVARATLDALLATKRIQPRLFQALATGAPPAIRGRFIRRWNQRAQEAVLGVLTRRPELTEAGGDLELAVFVMVNAVYGVLDAVMVERPALLADDRLLDELVRLVTHYARRA